MTDDRRRRLLERAENYEGEDALVNDPKLVAQLREALAEYRPLASDYTKALKRWAEANHQHDEAYCAMLELVGGFDYRAMLTALHEGQGKNAIQAQRKREAVEAASAYWSANARLIEVWRKCVARMTHERLSRETNEDVPDQFLDILGLDAGSFRDERQ